MKKNEGYIKFYKLDHHFGRKVDGVQAKFTISRNGLLAALHRRGIGTAQEYFRHLDKSGWNTAGTKMSQRLIHFETRLRKFEGVTYDQP